MGSKSAPIIVSGIVLTGFVTVLYLLLLRPIVLDDKMLTLLNILIGTLAAMATNVVQFWIGSSAGSKAKDALIQNQTAPDGIRQTPLYNNTATDKGVQT